MAEWIPSFSTPGWAWLFTLLVPLIVFYFLKLKRPRIEVPSLALWRQVVSDQRVNAPFQKFRRNLLLLLQVLLLCLLALAATQPYWRGDLSEAQFLPILIDTSASMGAVDEKTGKTRLDLAREEVRRLVDGLVSGQQLSLISVNSTARTLTDFTDNRAVLREALTRLKVSDVPTRVEDGLRLAQALAKSKDVQSVRLYSDGNLPTRPDPTTGNPIAVVDFDLPFRLEFQQIPASGNNLGITALNARRASTTRWEVFIRIDGAPAASTAGRVTLRNHGRVVGQEDVILGPAETQRLVFSIDADAPAALEAVIEPDGFDALKSDNIAWLDLPVGRDLTVYCATTLDGYRHALRGLPGVLVEPGEDGTSKLGAYDLVISDNEVDAAREADTYLFVGVVPGELAGQLSVSAGVTDVVDWKRDSSLLQHVQMREVQSMDLPQRGDDVTDADVESRGYEYLAHGARGPLMLQKREGSKLRIYFLFHTDRSTLPYRIGFPVMVSNLANMALQQAELAEMSAATTGALPRIRLDANQAYRITSPAGEHFDQSADAIGDLLGIPATAVGRYEIRKEGTPVRSIGVSLLNPTETSLATVSEIQMNEVAVSAEGERVKADKPWWPMLSLLGFGLLLVEWWVFQKKPSGMPD
ncbi:MAG: BatA and WFA domain-containing protein [Planctomyces sp.]|nr:BatA and WFA domain-containing protein [Planctomyces sp.]